MKAYSNELRQKIVEAVASGEGKTEVARRFGISRSSVKRYVAQMEQQGHLQPRPRPGRKTAISGEKLDKLKELIEATPDATLAEQSAQWEKEYGVKLSRATFSRTLKRMKFTYKKNSKSE